MRSGPSTVGGVGLTFTTRPSESPWISSVWTCASDDVATMTSVASETWGLVFWKENGVAQAAVVGPETGTSEAPVPQDADFVGIQFSVGTSLRMTPIPSLVDRGTPLPDVMSRTFWLDGHRWPTPSPDDAELLVERLVRRGVVGRDDSVTRTLGGAPPEISLRSLERRFRTATGLTRRAIGQIERVRAAARALSAGTPTADVVMMLGYYDEPHLARSLRRYVGRTAGQLRAGEGGPIGLDVAQCTTS